MDIKFDKNSCRVCFKNVGVIPLFSDYEDGVPAETISSLFNIYISCAVNLPNAVCEICMEHIKIAISSKEAIIYAENILNDYLATNNSFEIEQEENFPIKEYDTPGHYLPILDNLDDLEHLKTEHTGDKILDRFECHDISSELISSQLYECLKCEVKTYTYKQLIQHMRSHADIALYECEICGNEYKRQDYCVKHASRHYNNRPYKCEKCGKGFKTNGHLGEHFLTHQTERILPCEQCDKTFCHIKALKAHSRYHNEETEVCEICGKLFKHSTFLKIHIGTVHGLSTGRSGNKCAYSKWQRVTCEFCGKLIIYSYLNHHIKAQHNDSIPVKSDSGNAIICLYCNKSFLTNLGLKMHMQTHINTKNIPLDIKTKEKYLKYKCDECDKCFVSAAFLKKHKILHSGIKEHPCPHCGKKFAFKIYLERHVRLLHDTTNPRNFNCHICGKVSTFEAARKAHMLTHTREKPFGCKFCGSKFAYAQSLRIHLKNKHKTEINENSEKT